MKHIYCAVILTLTLQACKKDPTPLETLNPLFNDDLCR